MSRGRPAASSTSSRSRRSGPTRRARTSCRSRKRGGAPSELGGGRASMRAVIAARIVAGSSSVLVVLLDRGHQLLDEERVAVCSRDDLGDRGRREAPEEEPTTAASASSAHSAAASCRRPSPGAPARPRLEELGPRECDEHDALVPHVRAEVLDEIERGVVRPVDVVEHDQQRARGPTGARGSGASRTGGRSISLARSSSPRPTRSDRYRVVEATSSGGTATPAVDASLARATSTGSFSKIPAVCADDLGRRAPVRRLLLVRQAAAPEHAAALRLDLRRDLQRRAATSRCPAGPRT